MATSASVVPSRGGRGVRSSPAVSSQKETEAGSSTQRIVPVRTVAGTPCCGNRRPRTRRRRRDRAAGGTVVATTRPPEVLPHVFHPDDDRRPVPLARPHPHRPLGCRRGRGMGVHAHAPRRRDLRDRVRVVLRRGPGHGRRVDRRAHPVARAVGARRQRGRGRGRRDRQRGGAARTPRPPPARSWATRPTSSSASWTPPGWSSQGRAVAARSRPESRARGP